MFSFGIAIQNFVKPFLDLFTVAGFAPLLAFCMVAATLLIGLRVYFWHSRPGKTDLQKVSKVLSTIQGQQDFTNRYGEVDALLSETKILKHGWEEFRETLVFPSDQDKIQVIRNTVRPGFYLHVSEIENTLRLKRIHFVSNLLIGIGLLLTFIGLVAALTEAGAAIGANTTNGDFQEPIKKLLAVAAFKFWTSVSGLGCSIGLRIFYEVQHNNIKSLLSQINSSIERGLQFVTPEFLAVEHLREAQEQSAAMKRFSTDVAVSLTTALKPVSDSLQDIGQRISGGIGDAIKDAAGSEMQALAQNLGGIVQSLNTSRTEMDNVASTMRGAITEAAAALRAASGDASNEMTQQLKEVMATISEGNRKQAQIFDDSMQRLSSLIDQAGGAAGNQIAGAAQNLASGMNGISDGVKDAASSMAERMGHLSSVMESIEERMGKHIQAMDTLTTRAQDTEKSIGITSRIMTEAALPVTQASEKMASTADSLNQSIQGARQIIEQSHSGLVTLAKKMEETQQTLQSSWQAYDQRFGAVDESLGRAVQGIVQNVKDNIQSMSDFVREVDQKLGQAVQTFGQSIGELNDTAEDFEKASDNLLKSVDRMNMNKAA